MGTLSGDERHLVFPLIPGMRESSLRNKALGCFAGAHNDKPFSRRSLMHPSFAKPRLRVPGAAQHEMMRC
jgi:hypothetical protein